jgi:hypothetical protein
MIKNIFKAKEDPSPCNCEQGKYKEEWICGSMSILQGDIPKTTPEWSKTDKIGEIKARIFNSFRSNYRVKPGLYAIGNPDNLSDIFISANYKLSFDILRRELRGVDGWILVLDTKGINVWCAAGKGTFGTGELISKIQEVALDKIVDHQKIIAPQLGASGVSAFQVKNETGFKVIYGPAQAEDIQDYLKNGYTATEEMRKVPFTLKDRLLLAPMEITLIIKKIWIYILAVLLFFGLMPEGIIFKYMLNYGGQFIIFGIASVIIGAILTPALLPYIPFRSFALKGWASGAFIFLIVLLSIQNELLSNSFIVITCCLLFPVISSYLALNFTGCTPFTSESGVKKEMSLSIPLYIGALSVSVVCLVLFKLQQWSLL